LVSSSVRRDSTLPPHTAYLYLLGPSQILSAIRSCARHIHAPWPFFLTNVSLGAALAAALTIVLDTHTHTTAWNWDVYKGLFVASLLQDVLLLPCGFIAAWLLVQGVSAETLLTAFAYAS